MRPIASCFLLFASFIAFPCLSAAAPEAVELDAAKFPSIQAALDALPATGGLVRLPPGLVEITQPLLVKTGDTRILGSGAATCIKNLNEEGKPALILRPPTLDADKKARLWRVQLADFRLEGQAKSGDGIYAEGIQEIYLEGLSIDHHGGHGIHLVSCFEDPRIADCILTYNQKSGLEIFDCHDIVVSANHFEENQDALRCLDSFNLCMTGNNIDDHLGHGIVIENTYGSVVSGNMIEECNGTAIILDRDAYGITLSANVIAHHLGGGIDLRDAHGCSISANTFVLAHRFGVRLGPETARHSISGNSFTNSYIGQGQDKRPATGPTPMHIDEGAGIWVDGGKDSVITGNSFTGLGTAAVWATATAEGLLISQNLCRDCGRKLPKDAPWIAVPEGKDHLIRDNLIRQGK
ncbi:MAG: right-handed parallel beta-helix repeat-containing protein [Prosthecobacter sp.]|nr:right-handed parallel beta-helix repeat-containing protein [Prosthecobacter sp.]